MAYINPRYKRRTQLHGASEATFRMVGSAVKGGRTADKGAVLGGSIDINPSFFNQTVRYLETIMNNLTWLKSGVQISKYISQIAGASVAKNFALQRGTKTHWKRLAKHTQKIRQRQGFDPRKPVLHRSGNLYTAATQGLVVDTGFSGKLSISIEPAIFRTTKYDTRRVSAKTGKPWKTTRKGSVGVSARQYFMAHQMGTKKIPQRDFFWIRREDFSVIGDLMVATVLRQATAVAEKRMSNAIYANFATRMSSLQLSADKFMNQSCVSDAARTALAKVQAGVEM